MRCGEVVHESYREGAVRWIREVARKLVRLQVQVQVQHGVEEGWHVHLIAGPSPGKSCGHTRRRLPGHRPPGLGARVNVYKQDS